MQFNHDNMTGALLAADLVNLADEDWSVASVRSVLREHGIRWAHVDASVATTMRRWALRLRAVFVSETVAQRCRSINALLTDGARSVYLTTHDDLRPHLHFAGDDDDLMGRVMAVTAGGLAIFTVEAEGRRLGACSRAGCRKVFVDTSRTGRRAYCCARCGNADAVQRHRARAADRQGRQ